MHHLAAAARRDKDARAAGFDGARLEQEWYSGCDTDDLCTRRRNWSLEGDGADTTEVRNAIGT